MVFRWIQQLIIFFRSIKPFHVIIPFAFLVPFLSSDLHIGFLAWHVNKNNLCYKKQSDLQPIWSIFFWVWNQISESDGKVFTIWGNLHLLYWNIKLMSMDIRRVWPGTFYIKTILAVKLTIHSLKLWRYSIFEMTFVLLLLLCVGYKILVGRHV